MSMLYLVRHGQASAGTHDYDRLSSLGVRQSELLGEWWSGQGFRPDHTYHGSMVRQRDTAKFALRPLPPGNPSVEHAGLNEYNHRVIESHFGEHYDNDNPESMTFEHYIDIMSRWKDAHEHQIPADSETWSEFSQRGWNTVVDAYANQPKNSKHVFFTSGGVIATLVSHVLSLDFDHTIDAIWRIRNSSITTIHFDGSRARLVDFNTVPHLHSQHDESLITLI